MHCLPFSMRRWIAVLSRLDLGPFQSQRRFLARSRLSLPQTMAACFCSCTARSTCSTSMQELCTVWQSAYNDSEDICKQVSGVHLYRRLVIIIIIITITVTLEQRQR